MFSNYIKRPKKKTKDALSKRLGEQKAKKESLSSPAEIEVAEARIASTSLSLDTVGICMFYFIALYYEFKAQYTPGVVISYNYDKYYSDKDFRKELISDVANLFLSQTIRILIKTAQDNGKAGNVNNWIRSAACEPAFLNALRDALATDFELEQKYTDFYNKYSV